MSTHFHFLLPPNSPSTSLPPPITDTSLSICLIRTDGNHPFQWHWTRMGSKIASSTRTSVICPWLGTGKTCKGRGPFLPFFSLVYWSGFTDHFEWVFFRYMQSCEEFAMQKFESAEHAHKIMFETQIFESTEHAYRTMNQADLEAQNGAVVIIPKLVWVAKAAWWDSRGLKNKGSGPQCFFFSLFILQLCC